MTALAILKEARALIDEKGWTQGAHARDDRGVIVETESPKAVCFCVSGALRQARVNLHEGLFDGLAGAADWFKEAAAIRSIPAWNDAPTRTKVDVLAVFDKAIALAEKGAPRG